MNRAALGLALLLLAGCGEALGIGDECVDGADCESGLGCFIGPADQQRCMERCDPSTTWLCESGPVCFGDGVADPGETGACYLGGSGAVGDTCETNLDCGFGLACISQSDGEAFQCFRACAVTDGGCPTGQTCAPLTENDGFCRPDA